MLSRRSPLSVYAFAISGTLAALGGNALAQSNAPASYPDKPIRLIVPFPAGGATDILARTVGPKLTEAWGQPVIIDNRGGAGGTIAAALVARARPDGHTLILGEIGNLAIGTSIYQNLPYDSLRDFAPISHLINQPIVVASHPSFAPTTVKELIAHAKARPGETDFASPSVGGAMHLAGELFQTQAGVKLSHVPYQGGGPVIAALLGGKEVSLAFVGLAPALPHINAKRLRAIAVAGSERAPVAPEVPTISETLPGYQVNFWIGLLAPAGTPQPILDKLNAEVVNIVRNPETRRHFEQVVGFGVVGSSQGQFAATIRQELEKWGRVVRVAGIRPQ